MQLDTLAQTTLTMSSQEIAELTGKEHRNVMRDIRAMLVELHGEDRVLSFEQTVERPNPSGGAPIKSVAFNLPKRETLILISGYNVKMRAAIIDRWQQLEESTAKIEVVDPRTKALIDSLIRFDALEQEQKRMEHRQHQLENRLDQIETAQDHFTVVGYATAFNKGSLPLELSAKIGAKAAKHCKASGIEMGNVPDPRFGRVKTYPKAVLDLVFGTYEPKALAA